MQPYVPLLLPELKVSTPVCACVRLRASTCVGTPCLGSRCVGSGQFRAGSGAGGWQAWRLRTAAAPAAGGREARVGLGPGVAVAALRARSPSRSLPAPRRPLQAAAPPPPSSPPPAHCRLRWWTPYPRCAPQLPRPWARWSRVSGVGVCERVFVCVCVVRVCLVWLLRVRLCVCACVWMMHALCLAPASQPASQRCRSPVTACAHPPPSPALAPPAALALPCAVPHTCLPACLPPSRLRRHG